jgi:hypothetical protein
MFSGFVEGVLFGNTPRQRGNVDGATAFIRRFADGFLMHGKRGIERLLITGGAAFRGWRSCGRFWREWPSSDKWFDINSEISPLFGKMS